MGTSWVGRIFKSGVVTPVLIAAAIILILTMMFQRGPGLKASAVAVEQSGFSIGAAIGFIPAFLASLNQGRTAAGNTAQPHAAAKPQCKAGQSSTSAAPCV
jgi:hypothetical protein